MYSAVAVAVLAVGAQASYNVASYPAVNATSSTAPSYSAVAPSSASYSAVVPSSHVVSSSVPTGYHVSTPVAYTTEVVDIYTTYCPVATEVTIGTKTYTVTKPTTLTVTDCSCTVTRPVYTATSVPPTPYGNVTVPVPVGKPTTVSTIVPTGGYPAKPTSPTVPTAGAGKVAALSGAALAGFVGLAALL